MAYVPTYYDVLNLPKSLHNGLPLPVKILRIAYHRALLQNHPDKSASNASAKDAHAYSIDQISEAFSILSDPSARAKYDRELKLQKVSDSRTKLTGTFYTGIEMVDLDDMVMDDSRGLWYQSCRCGDERGFQIQERDLEMAEEEREIHVGCKGCSLWLRVQFGVSEE